MASLQEYALQNQLRTAGTQALTQAFQQAGTDIKEIRDNDKYKNAASQAAELWKQGDQKGALAAMSQVDPALARSVFSDMGKLQTQKDYGQLPTQVAAAKASAIATGKGFQKDALEINGHVVPVSFETATGKYYYPGGEPVPAEVISNSDKGYKPTIRTDQNTKDAERITASGKATAVASPSPIIEQAADGAGIVLTPKQNDGLIKFTDDFNKDADSKALVTQINSLDMAKRAILNNAPGGQVLEQMRLIRGVSPRPAVQEVMALNYGKGWETTLESYATKAAGEGMSAQEQKNFLSMIETFQSANLDAYNQHLHSRIAQASENYKVDPSIVLKRVAPEMPTPVQENARKLGQSPKEDQEAVEWAHKTLLNYKAPKEESDKALKILQLHGL